MTRLTLLLLLVACCVSSVMIAGCTPTIYYSKQVVTPRLDQPVFTVIPKDLSPDETNWAADIQRCLLFDRLRVIERPALLETETKVAGATDERENLETKTERTIDVVATYAKSEADIIVGTDAAFRWVKFIDKRLQNRIMLSGQIPYPLDRYYPDTTCPWIHDALVKLGPALNKK